MHFTEYILMNVNQEIGLKLTLLWRLISQWLRQTMNWIGTVNYETLFKIVKEEMEQPSKLLETVAEKIAQDVLQKFPDALSVELKISKLNPPIGGKCKKATVSLVRRKTSNVFKQIR